MKKGDEYDVEYIGRVRGQSDRAMVEGLCSLCHINYASSMHHLIPRAMSKNRGVTGRLIPLCRPCHLFIHKAFSHRQLATQYDTADKLRANQLVHQFVTFIEKNAVGKRIKGKRIVVQDGLVFLQCGSQYRTAYKLY